MNYRLLAIAKTKHGTIQYAIVESESGNVPAIAYCKDGLCYDIHFLRTTPTEIQWILNFIKEKERNNVL